MIDNENWNEEIRNWFMIMNVQNETVTKIRIMDTHEYPKGRQYPKLHLLIPEMRIVGYLNQSYVSENVIGYRTLLLICKGIE